MAASTAFPSFHDKSRVNNNVTLQENGIKNSTCSRRQYDSVEGSRDINIRVNSKMIPEQITESVAVAQLPNYQEKYVASVVDFISMRRFSEGVSFEPVMAPVLYADTFICYKDSTRKRYVSTTFYEPRVKPRKFSDTAIVFPKRPEKTFVSFLNYHIDECRRWFKTCLEFKARTYTTSRTDVGDDVADKSQTNGLTDDDEAGVSQVFLPRFNTDDRFIAGLHKHPNCDINMNGPLMNGDMDVL
ncbi:refilin-A-like [Gigantopelta aegis]|uniref:refilin-A-like n=1 Tax=Gigantopelta aegis TaxID=1735272 RepID=UPI001B88A5A8|nr:refilin-A-like [Gigantopelta aegis]